LEKVEGITNINTDPTARKVTFNLTSDEVEYESKLAEFAKTNEHLAEFEIVK